MCLQPGEIVVEGRFKKSFRMDSRHQRNKLKLDDVPKLPEWQRLRLQHCSNDMSVPNLVIRRASVVQGHGDIFQRKNSGGEKLFSRELFKKI